MSYVVPLGIPHSEFLAWDTEDQDKALAWNREAALVCRECGTADWEWEENPVAYIGNSRRCRGCENLELERENVPDGEKGIQVILTRMPRHVS